MQQFKALLLQVYFSVALLFDEKVPSAERLSNIGKVVITFGPIVYLLEHINIWFYDHQGFVIGVIVLILLNMVFGGMVHMRKNEFSIKVLLFKTNEMLIILLLSYFTLEVVMSVAGNSDIVTFFRITIQVTTLLYPGSKILKNIFIFSKGQYPPEWLMKKIYNFQESGDLNEFLNGKKDRDA